MLLHYIDLLSIVLRLRRNALSSVTYVALDESFKQQQGHHAICTLDVLRLKGIICTVFIIFFLKRITSKISNNTAWILQKIIQIDMNIFLLLAEPDSIYILKKSLNQYMPEITYLQVGAWIWIR